MKLYEHQNKIINEGKSKAGLFMGTGSGKTSTALMLAKGKTLVICPKTQKEDGNWERECVNLRQAKLHSDPFKLTTISKETFRRDHEQLDGFDTVIIDEAHTCLGVTPNTRQRKKQIIPKASQLFEALQSYLERTKPTRLYLVTATVIRSPMTVWAAGVILGLTWDFYQFRSAFYVRLPMPGREVWTPKNDSDTKDRLAKLVRGLGYTGRLEDYFDVPEQTYKTMWIDLTPDQKKRIEQMDLEYPEPIVRCGKINQIENGVLAGDEFSAPEAFKSGKIDKILDLALEFPRMVIFAKYKAQIAQMARILEDSGYRVFVLTGETKDRGAVIKQANEAAEGIFIAQAQISAGWELPNYPVMIFASRTYSFVDYSQALGRIQRANNLKKNLYINLVVKGGVDEAIDDCLTNKKDFDERIYLNL